MTTAGGIVSMRPDGTPGHQECPEDAKKIMRAMGLQVGEAVLVDLDANQTSTSPIRLYEGPIESLLRRQFGSLEPPCRLYGHVWTGGPKVVIRYYEAENVWAPGRFPICAVARLGEGQLAKLPGSVPGMAIVQSSIANVYVVDAFR